MNIPGDNDNHPSYGALHKLHERLAGILFKLRSASRSFFTAGESHSKINNLLSDKITHLGQEYEKQKATAAVQPGSVQNPQVTRHAGAASTPVNVTRHDTTETEFSKHIKKTYSTSASYAGIVDKLSASAWEHIHTSLRLARQGNYDGASIHQEIAMNALEELGHYLDNNEYQKLVSDIEDYIK